MELTANHITLRGSLFSMPQFSHENHGRRFFRFTLEVPRLSGAVDVLPVIAREDVLNAMELSDGAAHLCIRQPHWLRGRRAAERRGAGGAHVPGAYLPENPAGAGNL